jgi:hypothetical protein
MTKEQVLELIDNHKNALINPVEMLNWTWLRLFIYRMTEEEFDKHMSRVSEHMSTSTRSQVSSSVTVPHINIPAST